MATRITKHASPLLLRRGVRGEAGQPMEIVLHLPTAPALSVGGFELNSALPGAQLVFSVEQLVDAANASPEDIRQRVDFQDGTWMALTQPATMWGADQAVVWSNAVGSGNTQELPFETWVSPLRDTQTGAIADALRKMRHPTDSRELKRVIGVALARGELTIVARAPNDLAQARAQLEFGRALNRQLFKAERE